jgi:hypothetical protein
MVGAGWNISVTPAEDGDWKWVAIRGDGERLAGFEPEEDWAYIAAEASVYHVYGEDIGRTP